MICPKCGRNNEGNICPYCDELEILDNTDEYLRRREEFDAPAFEEVEEEGVEENKESPLFAVFKRRWHVFAVIAGAAIVAAITLTHLPRSFNGHLSFVSQGQIKGVEKGQAKDMADTSEVIFSCDGTSYFQTGIPDELKGNKSLQLGSSVADNTGTHFAHTAYNGDTGENVIYLWDRDGSAKEAVSSSADLELRYISEAGDVVYTGTDVLNDQWYNGETDLNICSRNSEGSKTVCKSVKSFLIYPAKDRIIYMDKSGVLQSCSIKNPEDRKKMSDSVTVLLGELSGENNRFDKNAGILNTKEYADLICFRRSGEWIISDAQGNSIVAPGDVGGEKAGFIYDDQNRIVYMSDGGILSKAFIGDNGLKSFQNMGDLSGEGTIIWDDYKGMLLYPDNEGRLMYEGASGSGESAQGIEPKTLLKVENDGGYMYVSGEDIYYGHEFGRTPEKLINNDKDRAPNRAAADGDDLYYLQDGHLYRINKAGGTPEDMGECENLIVS